MIEEELFEVTTKIGCSVNCTKYCPQDIITSLYRGEKNLSLRDFEKLIATVPTNIPINFSGVCEPFLNPECTNMMLYAHRIGHPVIVFSTLVGLTPEVAKRIVLIPFKEFVLHLPDPDGNAHIPLTRDYLDSLGIVLGGVRNLTFMNMREPFVSNNAEKIARNELCDMHVGRVICFRHNIPNLNVMPNGDIYFCCICRGLTEKIGSAYESKYSRLVDRMKQHSYRLQTDPNSICHKCGYAIPYWKYQAREIKRWLHG